MSLVSPLFFLLFCASLLTYLCHCLHVMCLLVRLGLTSALLFLPSSGHWHDAEYKRYLDFVRLPVPLTSFELKVNP
ncbi:hypothetical protein TSMEX_000908 [Taenia solium]|eukprot:TsM_000437600 transcript=TsM_000437600 gene=TsM_000437600